MFVYYVISRFCQLSLIRVTTAKQATRQKPTAKTFSDTPFPVTNKPKRFFSCSTWFFLVLNPMMLEIWLMHVVREEIFKRCFFIKFAVETKSSTFLIIFLTQEFLKVSQHCVLPKLLNSFTLDES